MVRHIVKRDALEKILLAVLTGNVVFAGVSVFKDRSKVVPSEDQLIMKLEEAQKEHHKRNLQ